MPDPHCVVARSRAAGDWARIIRVTRPLTARISSMSCWCSGIRRSSATLGVGCSVETVAAHPFLNASRAGGSPSFARFRSSSAIAAAYVFLIRSPVDGVTDSTSPAPFTRDDVDPIRSARGERLASSRLRLPTARPGSAVTSTTARAPNPKNPPRLMLRVCTTTASDPSSARTRSRASAMSLPMNVLNSPIAPTPSPHNRPAAAAWVRTST